MSHSSNPPPTVHVLIDHRGGDRHDPPPWWWEVIDAEVIDAGNADSYDEATEDAWQSARERDGRAIVYFHHTFGALLYLRTRGVEKCEARWMVRPGA